MHHLAGVLCNAVIDELDLDGKLNMRRVLFKPLEEQVPFGFQYSAVFVLVVCIW